MIFMNKSNCYQKESQFLIPFKSNYLALCIIGLILFFRVEGASAQNVQIGINSYSTFTPGLTTVQSGEYWEMALNYTISDTQTGSVSGVVATISLPDFINDATGFVGTDHALASSFVFNNTPGNKKLTINFVDNVPTGSSGVLRFKIRTTNGITPNGTTINTCAQLTHPSGANSGDPVCHGMNITAQASLCGFKSLKSGGAIDNLTTYKIFVGYGGTSDNVYNMPAGTLNSSNITFTDTYPAGAEFISAKVYNINNVEQPTTVTQGANSVTVTLPDYVATPYNSVEWSVTNVCYVEVTLKYNSAAGFTNGQSVTNNGSVTFTPAGGSPITVNDGSVSGACTSDLVETHNLTMSTITAILSKYRPSVTVLHPNENLYYYAGFSNTGNVALDNVEIIETVPSELIVANGGLYNSAVFFADASKIAGADYQTNLNASWANWPLSGDRLFLPTLGAGEYITKYRIRLVSPFSANTSTGEILLNFIGGPTTTSVVLNNCLEWNSTTANLPANRQACNNEVTLEPTASTAKVFYTIGNTPGCAGPYAANQVFDFWGNVKARTGYAGLQNPTVAMFLPAGFDYVAGSETFEAMTSGISTNPTLTVTPNFGGGTRTLYRWTFPNGTVLPAGTEFKVHVNIKAGAQLVAGTNYSSDTWFMVEGSNIGILEPDNQYAPNTTDQYDWDGDGNTTETFRPTPTAMNSCGFIVNGSASMESIKWVKGLCDTQYSRYPNYGQTVPGGNADYRLVVKNTGNVTIKDIKIIDILPFIGDNGVVVTSQPRNTQWKPNLADPITAPAGVTVYYSTASNPCRDEVKGLSDPSPFPTGCTPANWTTTPPANITQVMAVKIDFGATKLVGGDSLVFTWPMRAPINAPTNNEIAWNSFAYVGITDDAAQNRLSAEPPKVGIKVKGSSPAYYGNRVWFDTNHDGIQDPTEGGVDGVKVKLFKVPSLGSTPNPATDELINFTITGNGGLYRFANLQPGFYYAVFCLPTGYNISPKNTGAIATDSDGSPTTYQGQTATITAITELISTEDDDTWDQGIYCGFTPTVSSNSPVPVGGTLTMTVTGGGSFAWAGPNGWTGTGNPVSKANMQLSDAGGYAVNVYQNADGSGCWASLNVEIVVGNSTCTPPNVATPVANQATCNAAGTAANNDASINISAVSSATSYAYTSDGTDPAYASAVAISGSSISITNLPNPASATTYKIRVFNGSATCYTDVSVVLNPKVCSPSCSPPNVAPPTATQATCNAAGTAANNDASVSISVFNTATHYAYTSDGTDPQFGSAVAVSGSSLTLSNLPNPASATTYKFRFFNGSATCYTDVSVVLNPKVCTPSCSPPSPSVNPVGICAGNTATFTVTGCDATHTPVWYSDITMSTQIGTGSTYTTGVLNASANFYVSCVKDATCKSSPATASANVAPLPNISGSPVVTQATCNAAGTAANNDASIVISGVTNTTVYSYTTDGSTPSFAGAATLSGGTISVINIANPASAVTYKFRLFNGSATCYTDISAVLNPKVCTPSCVIPVVKGYGTPATCSGTTTNNDAKIELYSISNGTKYGYSLGNVYTGAAYANATSISGSTASITGLTGASISTTYTVRVFNGSDACFDDIQVTTPATSCSYNCSINGLGGADQLLCEPTATVDLPNASVSQEWVVGTGNPATATIDASTGVVSGMSSNGIYTFILREKGNTTCQDEVYVFRSVLELPFMTSCESSYQLPTVSGVTWSSVSGGASVSSSGMITGMNTIGHYTFGATFGGCATTVTVEKINCACVPPSAGADVDICLPKTSLNLSDALSGTEWVAVSGNPAAATIDAVTGVISGMSVLGTYKFRLQKTGDASCYDEMQVVVSNPTGYVLCRDGSTSYTLLSEPNTTNVVWYNMSGVQVGTGSSLIVSATMAGLEDGIESYYYTAKDANNCDAELCCPVRFVTQNCCPTPNCKGITVIKK